MNISTTASKAIPSSDEDEEIPPTVRIVKAHNCATNPQYTRAMWKALPFHGYWDKFEEGDKRLETRGCVCGSTLALDRFPDDPIEMKLPLI